MSGALREVLAKFGVEVDTKALDDGLKRVEAFKGTLRGAIDDIKKGFRFDDLGLGGMISDLSAQGGEIGKVARTYGVDLNDLQRLMFQTGKGADELGGAFRVLARNASLATKGSAEQADAFAQLDGELGPIPGSGKKAQEAFKALGITVDEVNSLGAAELFTRVGEGLKKMESPFDRITAAQAVFGRGGSELVGALTKDADALRKLGEEYDAVGGFTEENLKQFKELRAAQKSEELGWTKIKLLLAEQVLPAFTAVRKTVAWFVQGFARVTEKSNGWKAAGAAVVAVLAVMNSGMIKFALSTARAALPWIVLFLLVEDVYTFLTGGKSAVGDAIDWIGEKLFGLKDAGKVVRDFFTNDFWSFDNATEDLEQFWEDVQRIFKFGFGETWTGVLEWLSDLDDKFDDWGSDVILFFTTLGPRLIEGLVEGITSNSSKAVSAIESLGASMWTALKNKLGIHSPSLVFRGIGENIDAGLAQGIEGSGRSQAAAEQLVRAPTVSSSTSYGPRTANVQNTNRIEINITGGDRGIADQVRDGLAQAFNDDRRATLAALEEQAA